MVEDLVPVDRTWTAMMTWLGRVEHQPVNWRIASIGGLHHDNAARLVGCRTITCHAQTHRSSCHGRHRKSESAFLRSRADDITCPKRRCLLLLFMLKSGLLFSGSAGFSIHAIRRGLREAPVKQRAKGRTRRSDRRHPCVLPTPLGSDSQGQRVCRC